MPAGNDIVSTDLVTHLAYHHTGFTTTVSETLDLSLFETSLRGCTFDIDGNFIYTHIFGAYKVFNRKVGFTLTLKDQITAPSTAPWGCTWSGASFFSSDENANVYSHNGFSTTLTNTHATGLTHCSGLAINEGPMLPEWHVNTDDGNGGTDRIQIGTYQTQEQLRNAINVTMRGSDWDGSNRIFIFKFFTESIRRCVGFTNTVDTSLVPPALDAYASCQFVDTDAPGTRRQRQFKALMSRVRKRRSKRKH